LLISQLLQLELFTKVLFSLKKLFLTLAPITILVMVLVAGLLIVQSNTVGRSGPPAPRVVTQSVAQPVVIEAKAAVDSNENATANESKDPLVAGDAESLWLEITDAISGLNDLVGVDMFLEVKQADKGQLEVLLDRAYWKRVSYVTRVNLKTDISNLWHLYVNEYKQYDSSVVYFIDNADGKVIDIFSQAN